MRSAVESEIMSMSELLKESKLTQYNREFCGRWVFCQSSCTQMLMSQEEAFGRQALLVARGTEERDL